MRADVYYTSYPMTKSKSSCKEIGNSFMIRQSRLTIRIVGLFKKEVQQ